MTEKQLLFRFMKERGIYTKCIFKIKEIGFNNLSIYKCFDELFIWSDTVDGYSFWYHVQLDFIKLLLYFNYNDDYFLYYKRLVNNYYYSFDDEVWKCHKDYINNMIYTEGRLGSSHPLKSS